MDAWFESTSHLLRELMNIDPEKALNDYLDAVKAIDELCVPKATGTISLAEFNKLRRKEIVATIYYCLSIEQEGFAAPAGIKQYAIKSLSLYFTPQEIQDLSLP